jgi:hypothetical protein
LTCHAKAISLRAILTYLKARIPDLRLSVGKKEFHANVNRITPSGPGYAWLKERVTIDFQEADLEWCLSTLHALLDIEILADPALFKDRSMTIQEENTSLKFIHAYLESQWDDVHFDIRPAGFWVLPWPPPSGDPDAMARVMIPDGMAPILAALDGEESDRKAMALWALFAAQEGQKRFPPKFAKKSKEWEDLLVPLAKGRGTRPAPYLLKPWLKEALDILRGKEGEEFSGFSFL